MQNNNSESTKGKCPACGKEVVIRSTRDTKPQYCNRTCAAHSRYMTRYVGTGAGPADRPSFDDTLKL